MNRKVKNFISKGSLGGAVGIPTVAAWISLSNVPFSEMLMYSLMGTFWLFVFLHWFFRDEKFDKLQAINNIKLTLLTWLPIIFLYAFMVGAYLAMFVSLGFFIVIYLIHLLMGALNLKKEDNS